MKNNLFLILFFLFFTACGGLNDAGKVLRNEKKSSTDEFLVQKREPLVLPPNSGEIPSPDSLENKKISEDEKLKNILKVPENVNSQNKKPNSIEQSILNKIKK